MTIPLVLASANVCLRRRLWRVPVTTAVPPVTGPFGTAKLPGEPPAMPRRPAPYGHERQKSVLPAWPWSSCYSWRSWFFATLSGIEYRLAESSVLAQAYVQERRQCPLLFSRLKPRKIFRAVTLHIIVFGPVVERELQARASGTNQFLDLDTDQSLTPPNDISSVSSDILHPFEEDRFWEALDIPQDSRRFKYPKWLEESGADLMYAGDGKSSASTEFFQWPMETVRRIGMIGMV